MIKLYSIINLGINAMCFQKIVEAGIKKDSEVLETIFKVNTISAFQVGRCFISAVTQLAMGGKLHAVEFLISYHANNSYVFQGSLCRRKDIFELLLVRGAIQGASIGGHKDLVEALLLVREEYIHYAVGCVAQDGHKDLVETLLMRGANIDFAARGAVYGGHISNDKISHILFLSLYQPETIFAFIKAFKNLINPIIIDESTEERAITISKNLHQGMVNYSEVLIRMDPECQGMVYLMGSLVMKHPAQLPNEIASIPLEVWNHIFNFITPAPLHIKEFERLGFVTGRAFLRAQLSGYQSSRGIHKQRAESFFQEASCVSTKKDLYDLVANQTQVLLGNNPYPLTQQDKKHKSNVTNATLDKYHGIIGFWEEMRTGKAVDFQDKHESNVKRNPDSKEISLLLYICQFLDEISLFAFFIPIIGQIYLGARMANYFEPLTKSNYSFFNCNNACEQEKRGDLSWNFCS